MLIFFPCGCTVCGDHLEDKEVRKSNTIKCISCNIWYDLNEAKFCPNKVIENILSQNDHLNDKEKSLKHQIEQEMVAMYQLGDELREKKSLNEMECHNHYQEMRRQIDIRREEAKKRIDVLYMEMIDLTIKAEAEYMEYLTKHVSHTLENDLDNETKLLVEKFRDPHLLIESLNKLKGKQDENISHLKAKLSKSSAIETRIKKNEFKAGIVFSKELLGELILFGPIKINPMSEIVKDQQWNDLMNLCEFSVLDEWTLRYRGSKDGFAAKDFHSKCDGKLNTLTIIKTADSSHFFGGSVSWHSHLLCGQDFQKKV